MQAEQVRVGQRIKVNVPGIGDHGQVGTIVHIRRGRCYIQMDWDPQVQHPIIFYPADLDLENVTQEAPLVV